MARDNTVPLRDPDKVMRLERMGCFHQTRLSFMRTLLRSIGRQRWCFRRTRWDIDRKGIGVAVYRVEGPQRVYSLICYANDLPPEKRSDRVIATEWDATFTLFDGVPGQADIERLKAVVPKQEAGHCSQTELVLARANRSVRLFEHVVDSLAQGRQPERELIDKVGYLMRTTAVYGNGKFGTSDRERISDRPEFSSAFHTELLAVWLIRGFTVDIAQHLARVRGGSRAVTMYPDLRRRLGVGNSTGLGMAPFLVLHPALIHSWMSARESALARVRSLVHSTPQTRQEFSQLIARMKRGLGDWITGDSRQRNRIRALEKDLENLERYAESPQWSMQYPWDALVTWSERTLSLEGQELAVTLVIEPHGDLVDDLAHTMAVDEAQYFPIDGSRTIAEAIGVIEQKYAWALAVDYSQRDQSARFWYYSEEKLEPRLGQRYTEPGAEKEHPLAYGRDVRALYEDLTNIPAQERGEKKLAGFLLSHPQHRHSVRRIQITERLDYAEIRDNLISDDLVPIDLLRCKLSFFGANRFDPKSDRWIRINMYQHAPFPDELEEYAGDDWIYPPLPD